VYIDCWLDTADNSKPCCRRRADEEPSFLISFHQMRGKWLNKAILDGAVRDPSAILLRSEVGLSRASEGRAKLIRHTNISDHEAPAQRPGPLGDPPRKITTLRGARP